MLFFRTASIYTFIDITRFDVQLRRSSALAKSQYTGKSFSDLKRCDWLICDLLRVYNIVFRRIKIYRSKKYIFTQHISLRREESSLLSIYGFKNLPREVCQMLRRISSFYRKEKKTTKSSPQCVSIKYIYRGKRTHTRL